MAANARAATVSLAAETGHKVEHCTKMVKFGRDGSRFGQWVDWRGRHESSTYQATFFRSPLTSAHMVLWDLRK